MQPVISDIAFGTGNVSLPVILIALGGSLILSLIVALVYKATHRGLSYSQSFQFSLVLLAMLGSAIMMIAGSSLFMAIGVLGAFSLIRFRTAIKDPKDMSYVLFVLCIGLAMGGQMHVLAVAMTVVVCAVILALTWTNFGMTSRHEAVIRVLVSGEKVAAASAANIEAMLEQHTESYRLLSAHARGDRMEFSYGIRPKRGGSALEILDKLSKEKGVENAEVFDAKHQVEF